MLLPSKVVLFALSYVLTTEAVAVAPRAVTVCAASSCFASASFPAAFTPLASIFCEKFISKTPGTVTSTSTSIVTKTSTPAKGTTTISGTTTITSTAFGSCSSVTTVTRAFPTSVGYPVRASNGLMRRVTSVVTTATADIPTEIASGCSKVSNLPSLVSSACSCFLTTKTTVTTITTTSTSKVPVSPSVATRISTLPTTITTCTSTSISTAYVYSSPFMCGIPSPSATTSGDITCTAPAPAGETNGRLRIEGGTEGTIFEGCISSGPELITTPSGGQHSCNGTNLNANPSPGATCTTQLDAASKAFNFAYDGTWSDDFQDYFITSIDASTQTATQFWGLLQNYQFTPAGGCQEEIVPGGTEEVLWAYDAFSQAYCLRISPGYQVVNAGTTSVQVMVKDGTTSVLIEGAVIEGSGATTDATGLATISVPPSPGCYLYKATAPSSIRSNAFYLTVLPATS